MATIRRVRRGEKRSESRSFPTDFRPDRDETARDTPDSKFFRLHLTLTTIGLYRRLLSCNGSVG